MDVTNHLCLDLSHSFVERLSVHVIHYTRLVERREHMESVITRHGLVGCNPEWMLEWDREEILDAYEAGKWGEPSKITAGSVSLILKHLAVYRRVLEQPERLHLILEDDVLIEGGFVSKLKKAVNELRTPWDLFFIGLGCNLHVPWWKRRRGKTVYYRGWRPGWLWGGGGCSRCTEAYLIHPDFARRLLESRFGKPPFDRPIDWHLNAAGMALEARSFWAEPPLVTQGAFESWRKDPILNPGGRD
mgnify:CR=1 FL=1